MVIRKRTIARFSLVLAFVGAALAVPQPAQAADNGRWSAFPIANTGNNITPRQFFIIDAAPGSEVKDTAVLRNNTDAPLRLNIYAADAFNTALGGGFALKKQEETQTDVGSWMDIGKTQVLIPAAKEVTKNGKTETKPGEVKVPFTLTVPPGATPGDHAGGLVTIDANTIPAPNQTGLTIRQANAIRVYVRVSGPITPQLLVSNVRFTAKEPRAFPFVGKPGSAIVRYTVVNSGNARLTPTGTLTLKGLLGQTLSSAPVTVPEVLPGQSVQLQQAVSDMPALDRVDAEVALTVADYAEVKPSGNATTWSISWIFLATLVALVALAVAYFWRRRRQRAETDPGGTGGRRRAGATTGPTPVG